MSQEAEYKDAEVKETDQSPDEGSEGLTIEQLKKSHSVQLKKAREKEEARARENKLLIERLNDLEKKVHAGTATQDQNLEYQQGVRAKSNAESSAMGKVIDGSLDPSMIHEYVRNQVAQEMSQEKLSQELHDAMEKDSEFKDLMTKNGAQTGKDQNVNLYEVSALSAMPGLKNPTAVIKHLLKSDKDARLMRLAFENARNDNGVGFESMIYNLSEQLESKSDTPKPSSYTPAPRLADSGHADDFDDEDYIISKYK